MNTISIRIHHFCNDFDQSMIIADHPHVDRSQTLKNSCVKVIAPNIAVPSGQI